MKVSYQRFIFFTVGFFSNLIATLLVTWGLALGGFYISWTLTSTFFTGVLVWATMRQIRNVSGKVIVDLDIKGEKNKNYNVEKAYEISGICKGIATRLGYNCKRKIKEGQEYCTYHGGN